MTTPHGDEAAQHLLAIQELHVLLLQMWIAFKACHE